MSDKMNGAVWDMQCPVTYNKLAFKHSHKYLLLAYVDHADHWGKNIYPAIESIATKTGFEERSVQRLTRELEQMGVLLPDGIGPRGTNKWKLPLDKRGDKIAPLERGDNLAPEGGDIPSGDIPSGDIPSGDNLTPESTNQKEYILIDLVKIFFGLDWWRKFESEIEKANITQEGESIIVSELGERAAIMRDRYGKTVNRGLVGTQYKQIIFTE